MEDKTGSGVFRQQLFITYTCARRIKYYQRHPMEPETENILPDAADLSLARSWWMGLTDSWKQAFNETMLRRTTLEMPDNLALHGMFTAQTLRFAGPQAPFPSTAAELEDLSGVKGLQHVKILIVTFHHLRHLHELSGLKQLTSLFVNNNQITNLEGVQSLEHLHEIYFNVNLVDTLLPLTELTQLHTIYCNYNQIRSLEGIGEQHRAHLRNLVCLPNEVLPDTEVIRMERDIGIRCKKG